jgi:hypothetical protein
MLDHAQHFRIQRAHPRLGTKPLLQPHCKCDAPRSLHCPGAQQRHHLDMKHSLLQGETSVDIRMTLWFMGLF